MTKAPPVTKPEIVDDLKEAVAPRLFDPGESAHALTLADRFVLPPFTQLDARSGVWQQRKKMWLDLGLRSQKGRTARTFAEAGGNDEVSRKILALTNGQSIFDPVLCEMFYRWFTPKGGLILDPFAGGSVRGIVAAVTGRHYVGIDLSDIQVRANMLQADDFTARHVYSTDYSPTWITGDSREVLEEPEEWDVPDGVDFVWSCPPYADLEKYSDDPRDLSNMPYDKFREVYTEIIHAAIRQLKDDRFCGFVVGEIRDPKTGLYRNFVGDTIAAFESGGVTYYNEAFLVSPAGTLPLRAAKQFVVSRKLGRTHQTVLIFVKGDPKEATRACMDDETMRAAITAMGQSYEEVLDEPESDEDFTPGWENG